MVKSILELHQNSPIEGHGGIQNTFDRITDHYFFPRMFTYVSEYVKSHEIENCGFSNTKDTI